MEKIGAASEIVGSVAGTLTTLSFLPQVRKVLRERQTSGISLVMYAAFTSGVALWLAYGLMIQSVAVVVTNGVTVVLAGIVLVMKIRLDHAR